MSKTNVEALNALCEKLGKTSNADTNLEALKNIYNALSGKTSNADLIATAIDDITTVAKKPVEVAWVQGTVSENVRRVNIPSGVTSIGVNAFLNYSSLESITIPDSVTSIGDSAFAFCSMLESIKIPNGVTIIESEVFLNCARLASITIPDSVTSIGDSAFQECMILASITIPDSVTSIGVNAFQECTRLANIYYKGTEEQWNAITKKANWNLNMGSNVEGGTVITYNYTG